jgi:hypothetical protein
MIGRMRFEVNGLNNKGVPTYEGVYLCPDKREPPNPLSLTILGGERAGRETMNMLYVGQIMLYKQRGRLDFYW